MPNLSSSFYNKPSVRTLPRQCQDQWASSHSPSLSPCPQPLYPELHFEITSDDEEEEPPTGANDTLFPLARTTGDRIAWEMMWQQGYRGGGLGRHLQGRMDAVTCTDRLAGDQTGIGYEKDEHLRPVRLKIHFVKASDEKNSDKTDNPHFNPSDLANRGLSHLIQWPTSSFSWEGVTDSGIPMRPESLTTYQ